VIYTDLSDVILNDPNYKKFFHKRNNLGRPVEVKSYYCIFKLLSTYPRENDRKFFEKTFDIGNQIYMDKLHPIKDRAVNNSLTDFSKRSSNIRGGQNKPEPKLIVIDSSDSSSDVVELIESPLPPRKSKNEVEIVNLISDDDEEPEVILQEMETKKLLQANHPPETSTNQEKHSESLLATTNETKQSSAVELEMTADDKPKTPTKKMNKFIDFGQTESTSVEEYLITNHKAVDKSTEENRVVLQDDTKIVPQKATIEIAVDQIRFKPGETTKKASILQNSSQEKYSPPPSKKAKFIDFGDYEVKKEKAKFIDFGAEDITEPLSEQNIFPVPMHSKLNEEVTKKLVQTVFNYR
jgi:hypothetical protein